MNASRKETTTRRRARDAEPVAGIAEVMSVGVRVAGRVPTRVDLRFAGTPEQMLGLSLGAVLIYLSSHLTARTVALAWARRRLPPVRCRPCCPRPVGR